MKKAIVFIFILTTNLCFGQEKITNLIENLKQTDFSKVYKTKDSIVNNRIKAIPILIELLKDTSFVKLEKTGDLIYPGAEKFYGHGWIVNYDIDWISVRSAWLLEEITFQNFGYLQNNINEDDLMKLHQENYSSYLQMESHSINFKDKTDKEKIIAYRKILSDGVSKWWEENKNSWSRFNALKEALSSESEQRQSLALNYLRFEKTKCEGLNKNTYKREIKPLIEQIILRDNRSAEQAKLLLEDDEYYWLKIKNNNICS